MSDAQNGTVSPVAIVTGAGSGIGQACAERLARDGYAVACFSTRNAAATAQAIAAQGGRAIHVHGDVGSVEDWTRVMDEAQQAFGPVGVLINAAGVAPADDHVATLPVPVMEHTIRTNLLGSMIGMQMVLPGMIERRAGKIINFTSRSADVGMPGLAAYSATKGAINSLTAQAAKDYAQYNININAISPGTIATNMTKGREANVAAALAARGMKAPGTPDRPAGIVAFLVSPESDYLNGIVVRCGTTA